MLKNRSVLRRRRATETPDIRRLSSWLFSAKRSLRMCIWGSRRRCGIRRSRRLLRQILRRRTSCRHGSTGIRRGVRPMTGEHRVLRRAVVERQYQLARFDLADFPPVDVVADLHAPDLRARADNGARILAIHDDGDQRDVRRRWRWRWRKCQNRRRSRPPSRRRKQRPLARRRKPVESLRRERAHRPLRGWRPTGGRRLRRRIGRHGAQRDGGEEHGGHACA